MNPLALIAAILQHPQGGQFLQQLLMLHQQRAQGQQNPHGGMYGQGPPRTTFPMPIQAPGDGGVTIPTHPVFMQPPGGLGAGDPSAGGIPGAQGPWGNLSGASNINEGGGTSNLLPGMRRGEPGGPMGIAGPSTTFYGNPGLNGMFFGGASAGDPSNGLSALNKPLQQTIGQRFAPNPQLGGIYGGPMSGGW